MPALQRKVFFLPLPGQCQGMTGRRFLNGLRILNFEQ
jgi:hypothetical protein